MSFHQSGEPWAYPTSMGSDEAFEVNQPSNYPNYAVWDLPHGQTPNGTNLPYYTTPSYPQTSFQHFVTQPADGVPVGPSPKQYIHRQSSPTYTQVSSISSSNTRSPGPETECTQARSPATPRDSLPPAPLLPVSHDFPPFEVWGIRHMGPQEYIKPNDIHPYAPTLHAGFESETVEDSCFSGMSSMHPSSLYSVDHFNAEVGQPTSEDNIDVKEVIQVHSPPPSQYAASPPEAQGGNKGPRRTSKHKNTQSTCAAKLNSPSKGPSKKRKASPTSRAPPAKRTKPESCFSCTECSETSFKDDDSLRKHIKSKHTRPFTCIFRFAGCQSTFASKNEWKRHCQSQHLLLFYWLCQEGQCAKVTNSTAGSEKSSACARNRSCASSVEQSGGPALPNGAIFNRKDLYTQHVRRMHVTPTPSGANTGNNKKKTKQNKGEPDLDEHIRACQESAKTMRCQLPTYMECPAQGCHVRFEGANSWDDRMEHVAKHLDGSGPEASAQMVIGGDEDKTLIGWASRPDVAIIRRNDWGHWTLCSSVKSAGRARKETTPPATDSDADADGESDDF